MENTQHTHTQSEHHNAHTPTVNKHNINIIVQQECTIEKKEEYRTCLTCQTLHLQERSGQFHINEFVLHCQHVCLTQVSVNNRDVVVVTVEVLALTRVCV